MKKLLLFAMFALSAGSASAQRDGGLASGRSISDPVRPGNFSLRTNLLYDALLTPTLGFEWRMSDRWGLKFDGSFGHFGGKFGKRHEVWLVNPEVRYYMGGTKRFYLGLGAYAGGYDIYGFGLVAATFPDDRGYEGMLYNGGLVAGYQLKLARTLSLDFNIGVGYTRLAYDAFTMARCESCAYKEYTEMNATKNWFGPTQAGISLVWHFGRPQGTSGPAYVPPLPGRVIEKVVRDTVTVVREVIREIPQEVRPVTAEVKEKVFTFDFNKEGLSDESKTQIDNVFPLLDAPSAHAVIEGHTDNVGPAAYNQRLSEERAKAVYDYFVSKGVPAERLSYRGYGSERPVADNETAEGRRRNRRVELKITD